MPAPERTTTWQSITISATRNTAKGAAKGAAGRNDQVRGSSPVTRAPAGLRPANRIRVRDEAGSRVAASAGIRARVSVASRASVAARISAARAARKPEQAVADSSRAPGAVVQARVRTKAGSATGRPRDRIGRQGTTVLRGEPARIQAAGRRAAVPTRAVCHPVARAAAPTRATSSGTGRRRGAGRSVDRGRSVDSGLL